MSKKTFSTSACLIAAIIAISFFGCDDSEGTDPNANNDGVVIETETPYSAMLTTGSWPNVGYYIVPIPSLTEGVVSLEGHGADMSAELYAQDVPQRNGYYYHANAGSGQLGKYHVEQGSLHTDKKVPFTSHGVSSYTWIDKETMATFGDGDGKPMYSVINIRELKVNKTGELQLTELSETFNRYSIGSSEYRDGKIFLNYTLGADWSFYPDMPAFGKGYIAVIDAESMVVDKIVESDDLKTASGPTIYAPASFKDENGDLYFVTDGGYSYDLTSPSRIHRIKNNSTDIDETYDFNLSSHTDNGTGVAMWYIGNGKAVIRTRIDADANIDAEHFFVVVNARTSAFIRKLDELPADVAERMIQAVIVENGKAYIAVTSTGKDYIWEYNPDTDEVTRGVELVGADIVKRLEKLQD